MRDSLKQVLKHHPKFISHYCALVVILLALLLVSTSLREWRSCFYVLSTNTEQFNDRTYNDYVYVDSKSVIFPFRSAVFGDSFSRRERWIVSVPSFEIKAFDWTDFLFYTILPLLCYCIIVFVEQRVNGLKELFDSRIE